MKMLFVADLHYSLKQFDWLTAHAEQYDLIAIGGDLLDLGSDLDFEVQIVVVEKYLRRIGQKTRLLVSSGNHDGDSRNAGDESVAQWLQQVKSEGLLVDGEHLELAEAVVTICPWWDGPISQGELEEQLVTQARKNRRPWIWLHHAPPAGSPVSWAGRRFIGDERLREWIERFGPDVVFSGHIHNAPFLAQGSWIDRIGKTWVFNPGRQIGECPTHISLDLGSLTAEWISIEGKSVRQLSLTDG